MYETRTGQQVTEIDDS